MVLCTDHEHRGRRLEYGHQGKRLISWASLRCPRLGRRPPLVNRRFFLIDNCHVTNYSSPMIKTFADKETQELFIVGNSRRLPSDLIKRAIRRLEYIHYALNLNDLLVPPSNRLHALKGDRSGQYSISINDQWRICFRFVEGDAFDVEITDYH